MTHSPQNVGGQQSLTLGLAGIQRDGNRVTAWGWCTAEPEKIDQLEFELVGANTQIPAHYGLRQLEPEPADRPATGFVFSADLPRSTIALRPVARLASGHVLRGEIELGLPAEPTAGRVARLLVSTQRGARAAWARLRHNDLRGLRNDALRRIGRGEHRLRPSADNQLLASLSALVEPVLLIIDHQLGGGSNHYRQRMVAEQAALGRAVLTLFFHRPSRAFGWDLCHGNNTERFVQRDYSLLPILVERGLIDELLLNNCVSYPDPLELVATIARLARRHGLAVTLPLHDYFCVCPSFTLLDHRGSFCGIPELRTCTHCMRHNQLPHLSLVPRTPLPPWRMVWGDLIASSRDIIAFSHSSAALLRHAYPQLDLDRLRVQPHPVEAFPQQPTGATARSTSSAGSRPPSGSPKSALHIGIVGHISSLKGADIVAALIDLIETRDLPVRVTVFGSLEHPIRSPLLDVTGDYQRDILPTLIASHGANVFLLPSVWPETFSFVLQELMLMDLPIAAFDLGAPGERLRSYPKSALIEVITAEAALHAMLALHERGSNRQRSPQWLSAALPSGSIAE